MADLDFAIDYRTAPALAAARRRSEALLATAAHKLDRLQLVELETIALAGSLGRLEVSAGSDFDCLVVARDGASPAALAAELERVHGMFATLGLRVPKADGIYREAIDRAALLASHARGSLDEVPATFGQRVQFLLDARPVYAATRFVHLRRAIIDWYGADFIERDGAKSWTFLLNDVQRYLHAYAGWQQFKLTRSAADSWELRQAKFRSVRVVTMAGLLLLLGASNHRPDKLAWLERQLDATPLERLAAVMNRYDRSAFGRVLAAYEFMYARLADPAFRSRLIVGGPDQQSGFTVPPSAAFEELDTAATTLMETLTAFLIARWEDWDPRFFTRLLL
ncbi:MAG: hypothetical protein WD928_03625 [Gammaproteobacteria bacterium]